MKNSCLIEAKPMELVCPVPTIHFKPVENKKKPAKGMTQKQMKHAQGTEKYIRLTFTSYISTLYNPNDCMYYFMSSKFMAYPE
jgi:hypothetical protein